VWFGEDVKGANVSFTPQPIEHYHMACGHDRSEPNSVIQGPWMQGYMSVPSLKLTIILRHTVQRWVTPYYSIIVCRPVIKAIGNLPLKGSQAGCTTSIVWSILMPAALTVWSYGTFQFLSTIIVRYYSAAFKCLDAIKCLDANRQCLFSLSETG